MFHELYEGILEGFPEIALSLSLSLQGILHIEGERKSERKNSLGSSLISARVI
jgi:hypothetical protein